MKRNRFIHNPGLYKYNFNLRIADILFCFKITNSNLYHFLKKKYRNYYRQEDGRNSTYTIYLDENTSSPSHISIQNRVHILNFPDILNNFYSFNDSFRMLVADILLENNGFLLHASSIAHSGKGYIFTGQEESGKSTISALFPKKLLRGDDVAIIRKTHKTVYLYGSPFYQKTKRAYPNTKTPIAGIFTLTHSLFNLIHKIPVEKKTLVLITNAFVGTNTQKNRKLLFHNVMRVVNYVNIFTIWFYPHKRICPLIINSAMIAGESVDYHFIRRNLNPTLFPLLPKNLLWVNAITTIDQLKNMYILNDPTWNFELNSRRLIKKAAIIMNNKKHISRHKERVAALIHTSFGSMIHKTFICLFWNGKITILDGNHTAVALTIVSHGSKRQQKRIVHFIVGFSDILGSYHFIN